MGASTSLKLLTRFFFVFIVLESLFFLLDFNLFSFVFPFHNPGT